MKTAVDKNESEFEKLRREALDWLDRKCRACPPFVRIAVENIQPVTAKTEQEKLPLQNLKESSSESFYKEQEKPSEQSAEPSNEFIYKWLKDKNFQTEYGEQEYKMYFDVDMPKIIRMFLKEYYSQKHLPTDEEISNFIREERSKKLNQIPKGNMSIGRLALGEIEWIELCFDVIKAYRDGLITGTGKSKQKD